MVEVTPVPSQTPTQTVKPGMVKPKKTGKAPACWSVELKSVPADKGPSIEIVDSPEHQAWRVLADEMCTKKAEVMDRKFNSPEKGVFYLKVVGDPRKVIELAAEKLGSFGFDKRVIDSKKMVEIKDPDKYPRKAIIEIFSF